MKRSVRSTLYRPWTSIFILGMQQKIEFPFSHIRPESEWPNPLNRILSRQILASGLHIASFGFGSANNNLIFTVPYFYRQKLQNRFVLYCRNTYECSKNMLYHVDIRLLFSTLGNRLSRDTIDLITVRHIRRDLETAFCGCLRIRIVL